MHLTSGTRLGPYEITAPLGGGGMGDVYKARDPRLNRTVAIKVSKEQFTDRFEREARAVAAFNHLHICQIYDVGPNYLVMEYIEGNTLKGPLPLDKALEYATQICDALDTAHRKSIIHRDLKPGNILVNKSGIKLLDFGLAKMTPERESNEDCATEIVTKTTEDTVVGTLPYMAPEQLEGKGADARSDIFAFGAVLYEMLTGKRAFEGGSRASIIAAILEREPPSIGGIAPAALDRVVQRCLAKDPDDRWQSARDLKYELERIADGRATPRSAAAPKRNWLRADFLRAGVALVILVAAIAGGLFFIRHGWRQDEQSIAVLPLADMSPDKDQQYFSEGLAEELLNALANTPGLRVAGRTSSLQFRGKGEDFRVIGKALNVSTILEGSVRKQGNRLRIATQLIKASDGFPLWSHIYESEMNDIFAVQEKIAQAVAGALKVKLLGEKTETASIKRTNVEAYNAFLQGRFFVEHGNKENFEKAAKYFEQAIQLDPNYAPAWVGLGTCLIHQTNWGYVPVEEGYRKAREAVERGIALDPKLGTAYAAMGSIALFHDWDWAAAQRFYERALELQPGNADAIWGSAALARVLGNWDRAIELHRREIESDPLDPNALREYGYTLHYAGRQQEAAAALRKALDLSPEMEDVHWLLAAVYLSELHPKDALAEVEKERNPIFHLLGPAVVYEALEQRREADANLAELIAKHQKEAPYQIAEVYAFRADADRAFDWLERAYAERDTGLTEVKTDPLLKSIRHDPRYTAMLKKMHLPL